MSKKVSLENLLPIALELFKLVPTVAVSVKPSTPEELASRREELVDAFAAFTIRLHRKLDSE